MLPAGSRLRRRADVTDTVRAGRGVPGDGVVVVHLRRGPGGAPRAGLVVSRAIGSAVVRNRVKRRLRHLLASRLAELPAGTDVVVRALPPAATASSAQLGQALDRALDRALDQAARGVRTSGPMSGTR